MQSPRVFVLPARSKPTSEEALLNSRGGKEGNRLFFGRIRRTQMLLLQQQHFFAASGSGGKFTPIRNLGPRAVFPLSPSISFFSDKAGRRELSLEASLFSPQTAQDCTFRTPPPFSSKSSSNVHFRGGEGERGRSKSFPMRGSAGVERGKYGVFLSAPSRKNPPHLIV